jgi:hypothetical protein
VTETTEPTTIPDETVDVELPDETAEATDEDAATDDAE